MTLTQLKYMIAVAEAGNFTVAAEKIICYTTYIEYANPKTRRRIRS